MVTVSCTLKESLNRKNYKFLDAKNFIRWSSKLSFVRNSLTKVYDLSPDLSPGSSPWDTNRTYRTRSSKRKYESAHFFTQAEIKAKLLKISKYKKNFS